MAAPQPAEGWEELAYSLPGQWAGLGRDTRILRGAQAQSDPRGAGSRRKQSSRPGTDDAAVQISEGSRKDAAYWSGLSRASWNLIPELQSRAPPCGNLTANQFSSDELTILGNSGESR